MPDRPLIFYLSTTRQKMITYLIRRVLLFIPTLIVISLLAFVISVNAPGDPVERLVTSAESGDVANVATSSMQEEKRYWTHRLGLDLPVFYFSSAPLSYPDTLFRIIDKKERQALTSLLNSYGNWSQIQQYHAALLQLVAVHRQMSKDSILLSSFSSNEIREAINQSSFTSLSLLSTSEENIIHSKIKELDILYSRYPFFNTQNQILQQVTALHTQMIASSQCWRNYIPVVHFYPQNQYHRWIFGDGNWFSGKGSTFSKGLIRGDLGMSYTTKMPVNDVIANHIGWSLFFTLLSVLLAYLISIPIGIKAAEKHGSRFDRTSSVILFLLHSMPAFWLATLLLMLFANTDMLPWFPVSGIKPVTGYPDDAGFFQKVKLSLPYVILPLIAYTYGSLAFLSRIMRVSILEIVNQDYIRTARAKGLTNHTVIYKHALRNALLPIITVFANIFPAAIGGSVILETIFTIPGMGLETYLAIQTQNYPVVIGVFTLTGLLTLTGYLLADLLYAVVDPRISLSKK
ncbi:MAG: ABC transporter permease [Chitinophagales bacterium]